MSRPWPERGQGPGGSGSKGRERGRQQGRGRGRQGEARRGRRESRGQVTSLDVHCAFGGLQSDAAPSITCSLSPPTGCAILASTERGVAQPGSAPVWGTGGRRFESSRPDHPQGIPQSHCRILRRGPRCQQGINHNGNEQWPSARVIIADDESIIRMDLREMLAHLDYDVVGEASDGRTAVELAEKLRALILSFWT